jgi:hypothetical protein
MPFVIAEPCIDVMDQACLRVCPVACIHGDAGQERCEHEPGAGCTRQASMVAWACGQGKFVQSLTVATGP